MTRGILAWYVGICAILVLIIQGLSTLHAISVGPLAMVIAGAAGIGLLRVKPHLGAPHVRLPGPSAVFRPLTLPFVLVVPVIALLAFALGWHTPANNADSMTYHLSRAAYWRQWHTLAHFPTNNPRQDAFPGNAEVLLLITLLFVHSAKLAFLLQFTAYLVTTLAVYGLGRQFGLQRVFAVVSAGMFATMPEVVLQSMSAQNDLTVAAFMTCATYFLVESVQKRSGTSALLFAAALGLAIGTKPTAALVLPGMAIGVAVLARHQMPTLGITRSGLGIALLGAVLVLSLSAPWYIANKLYFGGFGGPGEVTRAQRVAHPSVITLRVNVVRYMVAFIDPEGPAFLEPDVATRVCAGAGALRADLIAAAHIPAIEPAVEWPGTVYHSAPVCQFNEDFSWFGLAGWLVVTLAIVWTIVGPATRRLGVPWLLALSTVSYLGSASLLLRWQPWQGRLLITMIALSAPLLGLLVRDLSRRGIWRYVLPAVMLYAASGGLATVINDSAKPLSAWKASRSTIQVLTRPSMAPVLDRVARTVPGAAQIGTFLSGDDWDFPFFGPHLDRMIEPLVLSIPASAYPVPPSALQYLITHRRERDIVRLLHQLHRMNCSIAWSILAGDGVPWRLYTCGTASQAAGLAQGRSAERA